MAGKFCRTTWACLWKVKRSWLPLFLITPSLRTPLTGCRRWSWLSSSPFWSTNFSGLSHIGKDQEPCFTSKTYILTLTALGGGGGLKGPSSTYIVAHAKPPRSQPRRFMTFCLWSLTNMLTPSLRKLDFALRHSQWPFVTRCQPEKWDFCHFVYKTYGKVNFSILACKSD